MISKDSFIPDSGPEIFPAFRDQKESRGLFSDISKNRSSNVIQYLSSVKLSWVNFIYIEQEVTCNGSFKTISTVFEFSVKILLISVILE